MGHALVMSRMHMEAREGTWHCPLERRCDMESVTPLTRLQMRPVSSFRSILLLRCLPLGLCDPRHIRTKLRHHTIDTDCSTYCTVVLLYVGTVGGTVLLCTLHGTFQGPGPILQYLLYRSLSGRDFITARGDWLTLVKRSHGLW